MMRQPGSETTGLLREQEAQGHVPFAAQPAWDAIPAPGPHSARRMLWLSSAGRTPAPLAAQVAPTTSLVGGGGLETGRCDRRMSNKEPAGATSKTVRLPRQKKRLAWRRGAPSTIRKSDHVKTKEAASGQASG